MTINAESVVVDLIARTDRLERELRGARRQFETETDRIRRTSDQMRGRLEANNASVGASLKGLAGSFAAAFSAQQVGTLIDGYTRLQNSLKVAGLEGDNLASVQGELLNLSSQYGVSLEALAGLFGNASQAGKELGASQSQILGLTEATSQALLITGTSATQASGAILGLNQALAGGTVRAEEFNQINEGGLRPLLQAAANSERFGGSVAKLRAAVLNGTVSSREFFAAILSGSASLAGQSSKATLTLAGAFEALNSRLTVYVGESAKANGASAALAGGITLLAANLETVATALSVISAVLIGRVSVAMLAGAGSAGAFGAALFAMQARALGAATSLEALAFASTAAGRSMLAVFGGPIGLAIAAVTVAIGYAVTRTTDLERAQGALAAGMKQAAADTKKAADATEALASAHGKAREEALALARAERENTKQKLASAQASAVLAAAELSRLQAKAKTDRAFVTNTGGFGTVSSADQTGAAARAAEDQYNRQQGVVLGLMKRLRQDNAAIAAAAPPAVLSSSTKPKATRTSGKSAETLAKESQRAAEEALRNAEQFQEEMRRVRAEQLQDELGITTIAERRFAISRELDDLEYQSRLAAIENQNGYNKEQKAALTAELNARFGKTKSGAAGDDIAVTAGTSPRQIARQREYDEQLDRAEDAALQLQARLATTQEERRRIELSRLAIAYRLEKAAAAEELAQAEIANDTQRIAAARKRMADLGEREGYEEAIVRRDTAGPLEAYMTAASDGASRINEDLEQLAVNGIERVSGGLSDLIAKGGSLGDVFHDVANSIIQDLIRVAVQQLIVNSLMAAFGAGVGGGAGGLGGVIGGVIGGLFGRASGGYVAPGQMVRVNEGASPGRVEGFRPVGGGTVIPLGQMNAQAAAAPTIVNQTFVLDARGGVTTPELLQYVDARAQQAAQAGANAGRALAGQDFDRRTRPKI